MRKIFQVYINQHLYDVYDREGIKHGGLNGGPKSWWLWYSKEPVDTIDPNNSNWEPYESKVIPRISWEFNYKQNTSSKVKWGGVSFRTGGKMEIKANGKPFYGFHTYSLEYAFSKAQSLILELTEHPYNFLNPVEEIDRKIWYKNLPAKIKPCSMYPWEINIYPDSNNKDEWWSKLWEQDKVGLSTEFLDMARERFEDNRQNGYINWGSAFSDGDIKWFRK